MFWLVVTLFLLSFGHCNSQCAKDITDYIAAINDQYANVDAGAKQNCRKNGQNSPLSSIISNSLMSDLCDLETIANEVVNKTAEVCPDCDPLDVTCDLPPNDVVFLIDTSSTLNNGEYAATTAFVAGLINAFADDNDTFRVSTIFYSTTSQLEFDLSVYINNLTAAAQAVVDFTRTAGQTKLQLALDQTLADVLNGNPGDRPEVQDVVIMITDGESSDPFDTFVSYNALLAAVPDLRYISIGTDESKLNVTELAALATDPLEYNLFVFEDPGALALNIRQVLGTFCNTCSPVCQNGGTCIRNSNTCVCPDGFVGSRCQSASICPTT